VKKIFALILAMALSLGMCTAAFADTYTYDTSSTNYQKFKGKNVTINVYNWGQYISEGEDGSMNVVKEFEKLTGIKVNYTNFATNEEMYAKLKSGSAKYDVIFPSDYMAGKMISEGMITPLNYDNIPNFTKYIDPHYTSQSYDPENRYTVPYTVGYVGILYNTNIVTKEVTGWEILWDEDYTGDILMFNNSRDAFGIALKELGYSMNSHDPEQLQEAAELLKQQKSVIQAYVMDEIFDKLGSGEAAIAPYYAGDYFLIAEDNPDVAFVYPKEGFNSFIDVACVPVNCNNREAAELFINFLCDPEVAYQNFNTIGYATPNTGAAAMIDEELRDNPILFPDDETTKNCEVFIAQDAETTELMQHLWTEVLSDDQQVNEWLIPVFMACCIALSIGINVGRYVKNKKNKY